LGKVEFTPGLCSRKLVLGYLIRVCVRGGHSCDCFRWGIQIHQ